MLHLALNTERDATEADQRRSVISPAVQAAINDTTRHESAERGCRVNSAVRPMRGWPNG
jgi:hypothetical protein